MPGYVWIFGPCFGCGQLFTYSPTRVPSIRHRGERFAVCQNCVDLVNPRRIRNGLDPIVPLPGAYEPTAEDETL